MAKGENGKAKVKDSPAGMVLSISGSQKNAAKRIAKARAAAPIARGGKCSCCGQVSTSCTTGTRHDGCQGFRDVFGITHPGLFILNSERGVDFFASGERAGHMSYPTWLPIEEFSRRLDHNEECAKKVLRAEVHVIPDEVRNTASFVDGLGYALAWDDEARAWFLAAPIDNEDSGLTEKPQSDEQESADAEFSANAGDEVRAEAAFESEVPPTDPIPEEVIVGDEQLPLAA